MAVHSFTYTFEHKELRARQVNYTNVIDNVLVKITGTDTVDNTKTASVEEWVAFKVYDRMEGDISDFIPTKQVTNENSTSIRYVCESCGLILGWPPKQQIEDFLK